METTTGSDQEVEGLFSKRSSSNILSDPRILQHLRIVAQQAHRESLDEMPEENNDDESENQTRELYEKISSYNKRNQLGAFKILAKENLNYEGALRFYFEDGGKELTKAVRLTNLTTVKELLPTLVEKFKPGLEKELVEFSKLYAVQEQDEICLDKTEWPLGIALNATKAMRFILRIKKPAASWDENENDDETSVPNGKLSTDGPPVAVTFQEMEKRPMNKLNDFMYAGRDKSIKMTTGPKYDQKSTPKTKNKVKGRSLGAVLKLPKKGRSLERGIELSTNHMAPGILKVFGENISQDSTYKSVKATSGSSADVIIKQALGKHKLDTADPKDYVLCDVIGHFKKKTSVNSEEQGKLNKKNEMQWVTEYVRVVGDKEKPLVLQSLWKPAGNKSRRFEIRQRSEIDDEMLKDGTNCIVRKKGTVHTPPDLSLLKNKLSVSSAEFSDSERSVTTIESPRQHSVIDDGSISQSNLTFNMSTASDVPYLLLLRGGGISEDYLLHRLDEDVLLIGKPTIGQRHPDIPLYSEDIRSQHCLIQKKLREDNESTAESDDGMDQVFIEPCIDSVVLVNGKLLTEPAMLCPGDLVQIGTHYIFLYKDPVRVSDLNLTFDWMPVVNSHMNGFGTDLESKAKVIQMQEVTQNPNRLSMTYDLDDEDKLLEFIVSICESVKDGDFELVASYLFIISIEHSATYHGNIDTRRLILKITNVIQAVAWDRTKGITETNVEGEMDSLKSLNEIIPDLKLILFWMSNALEMLHFLQDNLPVYLPTPYQMSAQNDPEEEALANSDEELLNVLEEVAMFTFQQTVYHLTKVLYVALPLILDTNPFQKLEDDDSRDGDVLEGAEIVVQIFQTVYDLITSFHVHHQIVRQLFAYLFFFTNASLFNTLMDRGAGGKFYRWAKGAQIRGNLDLLEGWATDVGLQEEATDYLRRLSSAADVLATPKVQLLQSSWPNLRRDFPILNAAQLHKILTEYQVGTGKSRPANWRPTPEEVDSALKDEEILESFSSHPPFLFPTSDYVLDLEAEQPHPVVTKALDALNSLFDPNKESAAEDTRSPQVLIHAPPGSTDSGSQGSSPRDSVKSSPPPSVTAVSQIQTHKFSSSDPTLNHIAGKGRNSHLKNEVTMSKSASLTNLSSRTYSPLKTKRSNSGRTRVKDEVIPPISKTGNDELLLEDGYRNEDDGQDDVFVVELDKGDSGIGVGLIDGLFTPLKSNGIYVRTLLPSGPAAQDGRLRLGDRILAVNGTSLVGADYQSAMKLIRNSGNNLTFLVAKSDLHVAMKITASTC